MRIIAGVAKGRTLSTVVGATRPTSDRAREGLFSSLLSEYGDFLGLNFLDLFAGSGAIGLEALSRGASVVHAVEKNDSACKTIARNNELVTQSPTPGEFHLYAMAVARFLENPVSTKYDIVYIDPPYDFSETELNKCLVALQTGNFLKEDSVVAVERANKSATLKWPLGYADLRQRKYGQAVICYAKVAQNG